MEVDEIQSCNGSREQYRDEEDDGGANRLRGWHHSSRIIRVSRASGGKDRHSKVWTSKGPRDRRVRLSVTTAIQFYDLQDRLGYDQPSKAVEWLIKAAADAITELPSLSGSFPHTPKQLFDADRTIDSVEEIDGEGNFRQLSKSKSSSPSETSKGSVLSLARSDVRINRVKARERAREKRAAKEKEKEFVNPNISSNSSFTELLTGNGSSQANNGGGRWPSMPMDYFGAGIFGPSRAHHHQSSDFLSNSLPQSMLISQFTGENPSELQPFSFVSDNMVPVSGSGSGGGDYNLNFTISSSLAGFNNRGTLQSNSPSLLPHFQRFSSPTDGSNLPFVCTTASSVPPVDTLSSHQFHPLFDGRPQLRYGGHSGRHMDNKGKVKN